jgi:hypothetical protein
LLPTTNPTQENNPIDDYLRQLDIWWKEFLRNNYDLVVATSDFIIKTVSEFTRAQTTLWLADQYHQSRLATSSKPQ